MHTSTSRQLEPVDTHCEHMSTSLQHLPRLVSPAGLYRDAEKQLRSSLKQQEMLVTYLELVKVYLKLDLPNSALEVLTEALRWVGG